MGRLSDEQRAFVYAPPHAHQSLQSWAGTGKTHTLTERVVRLLTEHGVAPESIIITTFTVEGARECMERLNSRLGFESGVQVGTMDSLANRWMRQYFQPADYYTGVQEYGTLLLAYLRSPEGGTIKSRIKYMIVDEFQDLSQTQLDIVMEFYRAGARIIAVGDVAQNIYEWRGCHGRFLSTLPQRIPGMLEFRLTANRRCTPEIIDLGNACLRVLQQPSHSLMRNVRPSCGLKPVLDTLEPRRSLGTHVLRMVRRYHDVHGIPYGDIAIVGRFKHGLFNVEESMIKANRFAGSKDNVVPFVTSASVGGDAERCPRRKPGHVTMMTLHQSKGLEWPVVLLLLWDPGMSDEEWRLMYVAVTRARDRLHVISPNARVTGAFLDHMAQHTDVCVASLFSTLTDAPFARDQLTTGEEQNTRCGPSSSDATFIGVVDLARSLSCEHIQEMRANALIPTTKGVLKASPGCRMRMFKFQRRLMRFAEVAVPGKDSEKDSEKNEVEEEDDEVDSNGLHIEFGNFVDRVITRMAWIKAPYTSDELLHDRDALTLLETVALTKDQWEVCTKYADSVRGFLGCQTTLVDMLHRLVEGGAEKDDMRHLCDAVARISLHCANAGVDISRVRLRYGRPHVNNKELQRLRTSYTHFGDRRTPTEKVMFHAYKVSLCSVVLKGRKSMWYHPDAYMWFRRKLASMMPCVKRFVEDVSIDIDTSRFEVKPFFTHGKLAGEADLLAGSCIVDFKCSKRAQDFTWLVQALTYVAMASTSQFPQQVGESACGQHEKLHVTSGQVNKLQIFNPTLQTIWEYDCSGWDTERRRSFLSFLQNIAR